MPLLERLQFYHNLLVRQYIRKNINFYRGKVTMNRDLVWLVSVLLLGGSLLVIVNSEDETNPNLIDIEELTCPLGEVLVSNTSLSDGYECIPFDPHTISHTHRSRSNCE